jgi:spore coat protein A, manganese oxidase
VKRFKHRPVQKLAALRHRLLEKWHIDFLDQNDDSIPDDMNGDGLITYGTGSSPDYSVADIWIGDKVPLRPEETGWQDTVEVDPHLTP